jgi:hypothetical protein
MADEIYALVRSDESAAKDPSTLNSLPETDKYGRTIFREQPVEPRAIDADLLRSRLANAVTVVRQAIRDSGLSKAEVKLKFALDAKVGLVFIGETGVEASIELKFEFDVKDEG